ncbi:hypothetical protein [Corynebacterium auris]|uniref:hypothetical protein n=1 Tax=Corynebacterium auris TaxID=44750 RepID=UPI0025B49067|nr:hypothetical protein [Corynebacterium auris]WJY67486.1 hypothetical protein CAURIS_02810 [Corynebacterium auris]
MGNSRRRVTAFMAIGVLTAILAGLAVWRLSLPASPGGPYSAGTVETTGDSTPAPATTAAPASSTRVTHADETPAGEDMRPDTTPGDGREDPAHDPLLPPNAVVHPAPPASAPTQVYRPSNVVPLAPAPQLTPPTGGEIASEPVPTPEPTAPAAPAETTTPTAPAPNAPAATDGHQPTQPQRVPDGTAANTKTNTVPAQTQPQPQLPPTEPAPQQQHLSPGSEAQKWWTRLRESLPL